MQSGKQNNNSPRATLFGVLALIVAAIYFSLINADMLGHWSITLRVLRSPIIAIVPSLIRVSTRLPYRGQLTAPALSPVTRK